MIRLDTGMGAAHRSLGGRGDGWGDGWGGYGFGDDGDGEGCDRYYCSDESFGPSDDWGDGLVYGNGRGDGSGQSEHPLPAFVPDGAGAADAIVQRLNPTC